MTASALNINDIEQELVIFLRNQDIFSVTERGVTNTNDTGTFSADSSHLIDVPNAKNIRSIEVDSTTLTFGEDYTVDYSYDDSGTIKCLITFTSAQTGDYDIDYDYGSAKIHSDYPRVDLNINSYPRISVEILNIRTEELGIGAKSNISDIMITLTVYANGKSNLNGYLESLRVAFLENKTSFYYLEFVSIQSQGPTINEPARADKILTKAFDLRAMFNVEDV